VQEPPQQQQEQVNNQPEVVREQPQQPQVNAEPQVQNNVVRENNLFNWKHEPIERKLNYHVHDVFDKDIVPKIIKALPSGFKNKLSYSITDTINPNAHFIAGIARRIFEMFLADTYKKCTFVNVPKRRLHFLEKRGCSKHSFYVPQTQRNTHEYSKDIDDYHHWLRNYRGNDIGEVVVAVDGSYALGPTEIDTICHSGASHLIMVHERYPLLEGKCSFDYGTYEHISPEHVRVSVHGNESHDYIHSDMMWTRQEYLQLSGRRGAIINSTPFGSHHYLTKMEFVQNLEPIEKQIKLPFPVKDDEGFNTIVYETQVVTFGPGNEIRYWAPVDKVRELVSLMPSAHSSAHVLNVYANKIKTIVPEYKNSRFVHLLQPSIVYYAHHIVQSHNERSLQRVRDVMDRPINLIHHCRKFLGIEYTNTFQKYMNDSDLSNRPIVYPPIYHVTFYLMLVLSSILALYKMMPHTVSALFRPRSASVLSVITDSIRFNKMLSFINLYANAASQFMRGSIPLSAIISMKNLISRVKAGIKFNFPTLNFQFIIKKMLSSINPLIDKLKCNVQVCLDKIGKVRPASLFSVLVQTYKQPSVVLTPKFPVFKRICCYEEEHEYPKAELHAQDRDPRDYYDTCKDQFFQVVGPTFLSLPIVFSTCQHNEIFSIRRRLLKPVTTTVEEVEKFVYYNFQYFNRVLNHLMKENNIEMEIHLTGEMYTKWIRRFDKPKQNRITESHNNHLGYSLKRVTKKSKVVFQTNADFKQMAVHDECFVKLEKTIGSTIFGNIPYKPRTIGGCSDQAKHYLGPYMYYIMSKMKIMFSANAPFTIASGMNAEDLGQWFKQAINSVRDPVALENDYTQFDSTIRRPHLISERDVFLSLGLPPEFADIITLAVPFNGLTNHGNKFTISDGCRGTGDPHTTLGNCVQNLVVNISAALSTFICIRKLDGPPSDLTSFFTFLNSYCRIIVMGDDSLVIISRDILEPFKRKFDELAQKSGFIAKINVKPYEQSEFCSGNFWPTNNGDIVFGPKVNKCMLKLFVSKVKQPSPGSWLQTVSSAKYQDTAHIPILGVLCKKVTQLSSHYSKMPLKDDWDFHFHATQPHLICPDSYALAAQLYGVTVQELHDLEHIINSIPDFNVIIYNGTIETILQTGIEKDMNNDLPKSYKDYYSMWKIPFTIPKLPVFSALFEEILCWKWPWFRLIISTVEFYFDPNFYRLIVHFLLYLVGSFAPLVHVVHNVLV
jgi:hypothetical protein